jgi:ferredoxin--NADP+ reductase
VSRAFDQRDTVSPCADVDRGREAGYAGIDDPETAADRRVRLNLETFQTFATTPPRGRNRRIHLRFLTAPVQIIGDGRVRGVVVERNRRGPDGRIAGTGVRETIPVGMVVTAVGFRGAPLEGLPFDDDSGTIPNKAGRVVRDGSPVPGVYVAGWLKRGPSGVIGTNKPDGAETAAAILADLAAAHPVERPDVLEFLAACSAVPVDRAGWLRLEEYEGGLSVRLTGAAG